MTNILIAEFDLFNRVGGGQTAYQAIVRARADDRFVYLGREEPDSAPRPANCSRVSCTSHYRHTLSSGSSITFTLHQRFIDAMNVAWSVAERFPGQHFDVVDTPDYYSWGPFLRLAFEYHGLSVGRVVLALHGTISSSMRSNWPGAGYSRRTLAETRAAEHLQFWTADGRYAVSESYAEEWARYSPLPVHVVDPLALMSVPAPASPPAGSAPPDLYFVGRREKRKGPDLFVDLLWWLDRSLYGDAWILGPDGPNGAGIGSDPFVGPAAKLRGLDVRAGGPKTQAELRAIYDQRSLVVVPSRYDQLNLIALEALLRGCPTAISEHAGVAAYLRRHHPTVPFIPLSLSASRADVEALSDALQDYDALRERLVNAVGEIPGRIDHDSLMRVYGVPAASHAETVATAGAMFHRFLLFDRLEARRWSVLRSALKSGAEAATRALSAERLEMLRDLAVSVRRRQLQPAPRRYLRERVGRVSGMDAKTLAQLSFAAEVDYQRGTVGHHLPERTDKEIRRKIGYLWGLAGERYVDRVPLYFELARLEHKRDNDLVSASYALRLMRWLGSDHFGLLPVTLDILRAHGYEREAGAAEAMHSPSCASAEHRLSLLEQARQRTNPLARTRFEYVEDTRRGQPRVAVIVSLYRAADKLPAFLEMVRQQTLLRTGEVELVFVDSGSPDREIEIYRQFAASSELPAVYARTKRRETIQAAWNRGIQLSRAPYLAFLGVDEGLRPDALGILTGELDANPEVDWVMADSIVTALDKRGIFDRDVMKYDRAGYRHDWHYLDCTFLSYVGGVYRRSIHDRLGYYDESFRAAGDTEFKNRTLPFISSKHVPLPLGVFNNYPDDRTTESP
ncbi:MAG: glycosyltransferase, partial [Chloroflexota bacterium]|nr:glycosyltransferase [Chloroflexota bacterium]